MSHEKSKSGFFDKVKTNNPFKRIIDGLEKIDEMKKTGLLDSLDDQKLFGSSG